MLILLIIFQAAGRLQNIQHLDGRAIESRLVGKSHWRHQTGQTDWKRQSDRLVISILYIIKFIF